MADLEIDTSFVWCWGCGTNLKIVWMPIEDTDKIFGQRCKCLTCGQMYQIPTAEQMAADEVVAESFYPDDVPMKVMPKWVKGKGYLRPVSGKPG